MLRIPTRLPDELEALVSRAIGACVTVHRELGPGFIETAYRRALAIELDSMGVSFETERRAPIAFKGTVLCYQRLDMVVDGRIIIELKAVERLSPVHIAQVVSYLRVTGMPIALLVNFNVSLLKTGIRRVIL